MDKSVEEIKREIFSNPDKQEQSNIPGVSPALLRLFPPARLERIKAKALRKYKAKQDIQYERWLQRVSE